MVTRPNCAQWQVMIFSSSASDRLLKSSSSIEAPSRSRETPSCLALCTAHDAASRAYSRLRPCIAAEAPGLKKLASQILNRVDNHIGADGDHQDIARDAHVFVALS